ncbi:MAG: amino acid ABC transporter permease [Alphaproteobacteria bacterium]|nr:amino acid ABC transporter permease [Alphaproteobacteria bacterium]
MSDATLQREPPGRPWRAVAFEWLRDNLFSSWTSAVLTLLSIAALVTIIPPILDWAIFHAVWSGEDRAACLGPGKGACWPFIASRWGQIVYGFYDAVERWRVDIVYVVGAIGLAWLMIPRLPVKLWVGIAMLTAFPALVYVLLSGGMFGLPIVPSTKWGGLLLTLLISLTGIVVSFPIGILLALGRRSTLPVIRILCVCFIEFVRGVPLITILFMASNLLPLFFPPELTFDKLIRALVAVSLFSAAYMAEVVRGGLQAIPKGQSEAAAALGLGYWRTTAFIVLPQALKISLPSIVSSCISLFKDTSLVSIIGFFDFLQVIKAGNSDPVWSTPNTAFTGYLFAALVYWGFCFGMSRYSAYLENTVGGGKVGAGRT